MKKVKLPDTVRIINTAVDGYGDTVVLDEAIVKGAFFQGTSQDHRNQTDMLEAYDAHCYVDETDPWILEQAFRLEGMYLVLNLYGGTDRESWYQVADVQLGVTKLLDNVVNNVELMLRKVEPISLGEES